MFSKIANNPVVANLLLFLLFILGISGTMQMNRELFPLFSFDMIVVSIAYPGASPSEVERGAVRKIEDAIYGITGIKQLQSNSREGAGTITISLEKNANLTIVKDEIKTAIDRLTTLPLDVETPIVKEVVRDEELMFLSLAGNTSERNLKELAEQIKEELLQLKGISKVNIGGVKDYEISIEVSEEALSKYNLSIDQIARIIKNDSQDSSGGRLKTSEGEILLKGLGEKIKGTEYEEIIILHNENGTVVRLKDIAEIKDGFIDMDLTSHYGELPSALIMVYRGTSTDSIVASKTIYTYLEKRKNDIPEGFLLEPWFDTSVYIRDRIDLLVKNGLQGIVMVFLVLWLFLELRLSFWVMMGIPASFGGALFLMHISGQSINMISLFTLIMALGIIVDDAIIVGENIYSHLKSGKPRLQAAIDGTKEVAIPVIGSVTTTIVAFLPMLLMTGVFGKFMSVIPFAMIACLLTSLFECFFILPAHLAHAKFSKIEKNSLRAKIENAIEWWINKAYLPCFRILLSYRYISIAAAIALLILTGVCIKANLIRTSVFPKVDQNIIDVSFEFAEGSPFELSQKASALIRGKIPEINAFFQDGIESGEPLITHAYTLTGKIAGPNSETGSHLGMIIVEIISSEERNFKSSDVVKKWRDLVGEIDGVKKLAFGRAFRHGPAGKDIEINLLGDDLTQLAHVSALAQEQLKKREFVTGVNDNFKPGKRELTFRLTDEAVSLGINQNSLSRQIRNSYYGREVIRLQRHGSEMKVMVRLKKEEREDLALLEQRMFKTEKGVEIPFSDLVSFNYSKGYASISKEQRKISLYITADVEGSGNPEIILRDFVENDLNPILQANPGVTYNLKGQAEQRKESFESLFFAYATVSLPLIFFILAAIFKSYVQPIIIMLTIPFGIIGAVAGHFILGHDLSLFSLIGIVALSGIVINDALVMIDFVNRAFRQGKPLTQALEESGKKRFRAILLTTLTTVAGLIPLLFEQSVQAQIIIPMAISISFGLITATTLTLFFVPILYYVLVDIKSALRWLWTGKWETVAD